MARRGSKSRNNADGPAEGGASIGPAQQSQLPIDADTPSAAAELPVDRDANLSPPPIQTIVQSSRVDGVTGSGELPGLQLVNEAGDSSTATKSQQIETQLKILFFAALVVGLLGGANDSWMIPAGSVTAYALIGTRITWHEANIEKFADSLYYMGFLFTIWGLFFAFGPLADDVETLSSKTIITQFGIKLITTVIALTARICLLQLRTTLSDQIDEPQVALAQMAATMMTEIRKSVVVFRETRDELVSQAKLGIVQIAAEARLDLETNRTTFATTTEALLKELSTNIEQLLGRLNALNVPSDTFSNRINTAAQIIEAEVGKLRSSVVDANNSISTTLSENIQRMRAASEAFESTAKSLERVEQIASQSQASLEQVRGATAKFNESLSSTTRLFGELAGVVGDLHEGAARDVSKVQAAVNSAVQEIKAAQATIREDAEKVNSTISASVRQLRDEIERS